MSRVLVVGLDGLSPRLVAEWENDLPNLSAMMRSGVHGDLESIVQPVTPAAWTSMISGRNPGHFGFTDFMYRRGHSYTDFKLVHSGVVRVPTLATMLPKASLRVVMVGVPITYPPVEIPDGACVSCFMAPSLSSAITHPAELQEEILSQTTSPYLLDVTAAPAGGAGGLAALVERIRELDRQRFDVSAYLMKTRPWDLFFMVAMGTDRAAHCFFPYTDPEHVAYRPDSPYAEALKDHYAYCDQRLGELIEIAGQDVVVAVVSDHGVQRLDGRVNLNDWLAAKGYLVLTDEVAEPTLLKAAPVDWAATRAWAHGYGGQIYLNVHGREPQGCVAPDDVDELRAELATDLKELRGADGEPLSVDVMPAEGVISGPQADYCPDLFIQVEDLRYLTSDRVGHRTLVARATPEQVDGCSHARHGFFALAGGDVPQLGRFAATHLLDVAPTLLDLLGVDDPPALDGEALPLGDDQVFGVEQEAELTNRLRSLYLT